MKMILPPDWDKASEGNDLLCCRFQKRLYRSGGTDLPYRFFEPEAAGSEKVPIVFYLHGADAAGDDNNIQLSMHDIGTYLVRDDMQKRHPCYVLAPQYGEMKHWSMADIKHALWELTGSVIKTFDRIDRHRIYIYGYSAGGVGVFKLIKEHPGFFAAAVSICGATGSWDIDKIIKTPLWMIHAADDTIVKSTYSNGFMTNSGNMGSADIYEKYKDLAPDLKYTEYPVGYMKENYGVNPHCSWVALSDLKSAGIWEWMFSKRLKDECSE